MKKLKKRYNFITNIEATLVTIFITLGLGTLISLVIKRNNPANIVSIFVVVITLLILVKLDKIERNTLQLFFLEGCQNGKNVFLYENVKLQESVVKQIKESFEGDFSLPLAGIFFEELEGEYSIYAVYRKTGTTQTPYRIEEGKQEDLYEVEKISIPNLKDLGYWIGFSV